jgi:uncharacterized protein
LLDWLARELLDNEGDLFVAYLKKRGFVGVGRIVSRAVPIRKAQIKGRPILELPLRCTSMNDNCENLDLSEYVCVVQWLSTVSREEAVWRDKPKLYTTTHIRASLDRQLETVEFLEQKFGVQIREATL